MQSKKTVIEGQIKMNSTKFKSICEMLFGRSWQAQVADYLMISRKTVSSWIDRGSIPAWVEKEIKPLATRRAKESKFAFESLEMSEDDFLHNRAVLIGEVYYYNADRYSFDDIKKFIENQKWTVLESTKNLIRNNADLEDALQLAEDYILGENDIASYLEKNNVALDDIDEIRNMRGDACLDIRSEIEAIYERVNK